MKQEGDLRVGWIVKLPGVNCQEKTYDELMETLSITLREALEFNKKDVLLAIGNNEYREERIAI